MNSYGKSRFKPMRNFMYLIKCMVVSEFVSKGLHKHLGAIGLKRVCDAQGHRGEMAAKNSHIIKLDTRISNIKLTNTWTPLLLDMELI